MTRETVDLINNLLFGLRNKISKLNSIEEKKSYYLTYLENIKYIFDEDFDVYGDEVNEIITNNFLSISVDKPNVFEADGYTPWLQDERDKINNKFYNRYEKYLVVTKKWIPKAIVSLNNISDVILDHLGNPLSNKNFNKQGLIIGDIQSGKTTNYTAVINKALDAGYKIVIVFAGLTRDLRNQTQTRLDTEILGYKTEMHKKGAPVGVGQFGQLHVEGLTCADGEKDFGDLRKVFTTFTLDNEIQPIVAIVKKNKNILENLLNFLTSSQSNCYTNGKLNIPVLIIDDEVDQASVDTKNSDDIEDASTINKMIRKILNSLNRYSYVGYTATPFANIFIKPDNNDIYPKDFIINLPKNEGYCGIKEYFGIDILDNDDNTTDHIQDLFVPIDDYNDLYEEDEIITSKTSSIKLPDSLKSAIDYFIIGSSIKKARRIEGFNSMLIHTTRFKNPSNTLKPLVIDYVGELYHKMKYDFDNCNDTFKNEWLNNFKKVSEKRLGNEFDDQWDSIKDYLFPTIESIQFNHIKVLNGDSGDTLDYNSSSSGDYIIIGGDKLSRGLTLEGLVTSYYYRMTRMYDSLLQMGRWFGYRNGWIDLCRVFTTNEIMQNFVEVGKVLEKFKADIAEMNDCHLNPRDVGQRIMYSPNLIPTARNKMRTSVKIKVSFSNTIQQVITFDRNFKEHNFKLTDNFIRKLNNPSILPNNKVVFKNINSSLVLDYLREYKDCGNYYGYGNINVINWINYIENLNNLGELNDWTIVINSLAKNNFNNQIIIGGFEIYKPSRNLRDVGNPKKMKLYTIKTLNDPTDFREVFPKDSIDYNNIKSFNPRENYPDFNFDKGLLSIYIIDLYEKILTDKFDSKNNRQICIRGDIVSDGQSICAPAIWFPRAKNYEASATTYYVNSDYLKIDKR